ncbi:MAG: spermidine/putrescine ABC transporter substrate-binding protein [Clostridia bacterium]|nr:spermidine/putrescine ABC transporter substrate-binding protein [Clostridia bacterium]
MMIALFSGCKFGKDIVTLNVYNWGEYISDGSDGLMDVNAEFEKLYDGKVRVNYKTYESNESMYTLLESGAAEYDVVIPSDYMIGKMVKEGMLAKLNFDNIPNYKYIDEKYKGLEYDPKNEYSVPYTWGTVGIFYNSEKVPTAEVEAKGWDILWEPKYAGKIFMFDNARDSFMIALKKLGYSMNTTNPDEWKKAYGALEEQKPLVQGYFMDQVFQKMTNEEGWIAPYYSGDGANMITGEDGNEKIKYYIPDQEGHGTNLFVDAMCVLKGTKNQELAEEYINFMCRTDVATANAEYICYSTPHTEALKNLDADIRNNPMFYPSEEKLKNTEVYITLPEDTAKLQKDLWIKLKCYREDRPGWWPFPN